MARGADTVVECPPCHPKVRGSSHSSALERDTVTEKSFKSVVQMETIYLYSKLHITTETYKTK